MVDVAKKVIVITGDTTQAISAIKDIQTASERVARAVGGNFGTVAKNLGTIFQKVDTKYLTDAQGNIKGVASASETLQSQVINTNGAVGTLTEKFTKLSDGTQTLSTSFKQVSKTGEVFSTTVLRLFKRALVTIPVWLLLRTAVLALTQTFKASIKFLIEWEYQMAEIAIVNNLGTDSLKSLSGSLIQVAKDFGVSYKDMGESAKLWAQQGRSIGEIIPLMRTTAQMALLTGQSTSQSVEDLTAVLKAYKIEAKDSINIIDAMTNVMLLHAVTAQDLASSYKQVASTASGLGVSFEELTGYVTAITAVTRDSGNKIGLTLRTIFSRITTSSASGIQKLASVPLYLDNIGNATFKVTPRMRNLGDVISELSIKFQSLGNAEKSQLANLVGGVRRQNQVFALFNNFTEAIEAQTHAYFGLGKASSAIETLTDTTKIRITSLQNAWFSFIDSFANTEVFKTTLSVLTNLLSVLDKMLSPEKAGYKKTLDVLNKQAEEYSRQISALSSISKFLTTIKQLESQSARASESQNKIIQERAGLYRKAFNEGMAQLGFDFSVGETGTIKEFVSDLEQINISAQKLELDKRVGQQLTTVRQESLSTGNTISDLLSKFVKLNRATVSKRFEFEQGATEVRASSPDLKNIDIGLNRVREAFRQNEVLSEKTVQSVIGLTRQFGGLNKDEQAFLEDSITAYQSKQDILTDEAGIREEILNSIQIEKDYSEEITINYEKQQIVANAILNNTLERKKSQGLLESSILKTEQSLKKQLGIETTLKDEVESRLKIEEAIRQEKQLQSKLGSDSIKLFNIAKESGVDVARKIGEVLQGVTSLDAFVTRGKGGLGANQTDVKALEEFKKGWEDLFQSKQAEAFFTGKRIPGMEEMAGGRNIPITERTALENRVPVYDPTAQLQQAKLMAQELATIIGPSASATNDVSVDMPINVNVDVGSMDEIGEAVVDKIAKELPQTGSKINKALTATLYNKQTKSV
jgi:TP901 family phage tail tape measure protein